MKSVQDTFDTVPEDKRFKFKLLSKGVEVDRFCYTLRKGKELPVTKKLENKFKYCKSIKKEKLKFYFYVLCRLQCTVFLPAFAKL